MKLLVTKRSHSLPLSISLSSNVFCSFEENMSLTIDIFIIESHIIAHSGTTLGEKKPFLHFSNLEKSFQTEPMKPNKMSAFVKGGIYFYNRKWSIFQELILFVFSWELCGFRSCENCHFKRKTNFLLFISCVNGHVNKQGGTDDNIHHYHSYCDVYKVSEFFNLL